MPHPSVDTLLTPQMRADLVALAEGVLPLGPWLGQKNYNPRLDPTFAGQRMPWREGGPPLTVAATGFETFFAGLLRETTDDIQALSRWERVAAAPLARSPIDDVFNWRAERGLEEVTKFGIVASQNVLIDSTNRMIARLTFYADTLPDLAYVLEISRPTSPADWEVLAKALLKNNVVAWPNTVHSASVFMGQFAADVLYGVLGLRNIAAVPGESTYATAVLTELGQPRRRGVINTPEMAEQAVTRFLAQIHADLPPPTNTEVPSP